MIRYGKVLDNNDPDKTGKIQVKIYPELENLSDSDQPWAKPSLLNPSGLSLEELQKHEVPEIDSLVEVEVSEDWVTFYYTIKSPYFEAVYDYDTLLSEISDVIEDLGEQTYPQPRMYKTADGNITFHNTETGEKGSIFPSGTFIHISDTGNVTVKNGELLFSVNVDENKVFIQGMDSIEFGEAADSLALFTPLKEILEKLLDHNHIAPTGPTTPAQEPSGTPLSSSKSKLNDIESTILKSD
jgi:hypothetical protein